MVQTGRGGLNPAEAALSNHIIPRDGDLGVAAKNVGGGQFNGDALLAGVDELGLRRDGGDLRDMPRFYRVTEDDALLTG